MITYRLTVIFYIENFKNYADIIIEKFDSTVSLMQTCQIKRSFYSVVHFYLAFYSRFLQHSMHTYFIVTSLLTVNGMFISK